MNGNETRTERWIREAGFTPEQVRTMGMAPDQIADRNARNIAILRKLNPKEGTTGAAVLRHLTRVEN